MVLFQHEWVVVLCQTVHKATEVKRRRTGGANVITARMELRKQREIVQEDLKSSLRKFKEKINCSS